MLFRKFSVNWEWNGHNTGRRDSILEYYLFLCIIGVDNYGRKSKMV